MHGKKIKRRKQNTILSFKKGNAPLDTIFVILILFIVGLMIVLGYNIFDEINTDIQSSADINSQSKTISQTLFDRYDTFFDGAFTTVFILLFIMGIIASFALDSHPIFFFAALILIVFVVILGAFMSNAWDEFASDSDISSSISNFSKTNWILTHLVQLSIGMGFAIMLVLYGKNRYGGG